MSGWLLFGLYTVVILAGGLLAALSTSLVRGLMGLIVALFGVAGMYLLLNAPFLALMQLLIYVGAVAVLVFFAIMLTGVPGGDEGRERSEGTFLSAMAAGTLPAMVLAWAWLKRAPQAIAEPQEIPVAELGQRLLQDYALAFELVSVVLLVAMAAAVVLVFSPRKLPATLTKPGGGQ